MFRHVLLIALALATPAAAEVSAYVSGGVQVVSKMPLGPKAAGGFRKFKARASDFSGAYYVGTKVDDGSFWVDEHRLEDAKTIAKRICEERAKPCTLYAVLVPAGSPKGKGPLVKNISGNLGRELVRSSGKGGKGSYFAAAVNRTGQYGVSWGNPTRDEARKGALLSCIAGIKRQSFKDQVSAPVYNEAVAAGKFDCKIVTEFQN